MKIAFLVNEFPTISETFILDQALGLLRRGHDVHIFAGQPASTTIMHEEATTFGLPSKTTYWPRAESRRISRVVGAFVHAGRLLGSRPRLVLDAINPRSNGPQALSMRFLHTAAGLAKVQQRFDIIHCHFGTLGLVGAFLRRNDILRGPLITTFYGADVTASPRKWGPTVYRTLFREPGSFIAISNFLRTRLIALGCPDDRTSVLHLGIRVNDFSFKERALQGNGTPSILTIARLTEKKGVEYGIRAMGLLRDQGIYTRYTVAGDGELRPHLTQLLQRLHLQDRVFLVGWKTRAEIKALLDQAHILLAPSITSSTGDQEGQGVVLQEAQAVGLPVLATRHNGFPESLLDGVTGNLVPERDPEALATALAKMIAHSSEWPSMGRNGREFVKLKFDADCIIDEQLKLYREARRT